MVLGGLGIIPIVGIVFNAADALFYASEGDAAGAVIALGTSVPVAGAAGKITRFATGTAKATEAADDLVTIYRAVGPNELADLKDVGFYRAAEGLSEGKYFFDTPEQVSNFAKRSWESQQKAYTMTSTTIRRADLPIPGYAVAEGAFYHFDAANMPSGPVQIYTYMTLP